MLAATPHHARYHHLPMARRLRCRNNRSVAQTMHTRDRQIQAYVYDFRDTYLSDCFASKFKKQSGVTVCAHPARRFGGCLQHMQRKRHSIRDCVQLLAETIGSWEQSGTRARRGAPSTHSGGGLSPLCSTGIAGLRMKPAHHSTAPVYARSPPVVTHPAHS